MLLCFLKFYFIKRYFIKKKDINYKNDYKNKLQCISNFYYSLIKRNIYMLHVYDRLQRKLFMYIFLFLNKFWIYFNNKCNNKIIQK